MASNKSVAAVIAEFLGTLILTLVMLTVAKSPLDYPFFISLAAGLVVAGVILVFGRVSGALLNPAVIAGLLSTKRITARKAVAYTVAQLLGGLIAYYLFAYFSGQRWHNGGNFEVKLLLAQTLGTFIFTVGWAAAAAQKLEPAKAAAVIGIWYALALLAVSSQNGVVLNPAVALGFRSWVWGTSVLGPLIGGAAGFQVYKYFFATTSVSVSAKRPVPTVAAKPQAPKRSR
jgi:glycerol uptake facilitator-like aquaporin